MLLQENLEQLLVVCYLGIILDLQETRLHHPEGVPCPGSTQGVNQVATWSSIVTCLIVSIYHCGAIRTWLQAFDSRTVGM